MCSSYIFLHLKKMNNLHLNEISKKHEKKSNQSLPGDRHPNKFKNQREDFNLIPFSLKIMNT